jgi:hypothetical protein
VSAERRGTTARLDEIELSVRTFLNGALVSDIVLDISTTTTDIIDYVATDTNGRHLPRTNSSTIIVEAPPVPVARQRLASVLREG